MSDLLDLFKNEHQPLKRYWMLMKTAPLERLKQMQNGLIYMNSLEYFSQLKGEEGAKVRSDELESIYAQFQAGIPYNNKRIEITVSHSSFGSFDIPKGTKVSVSVPSAKNVFIFCLMCIGEDEHGNIRHLSGDKLHIDRRMCEFGSHTLLIEKPSEFFKRYNSAIHNMPGVHINHYMEGGCGMVDYKNMTEHTGKIGLFIKDIEYEWQREYRFVLGAPDRYMNNAGALELNIGDISDISSIVETKLLISSPVTVKKRVAYLDTDGQYKFRN
ncbi:TPA: hypothetical protein ACSP0N_004068 [Aeromonas veronii]